MEACKGGYYEIAELLLENNAKVNLENNNESNALSIALRNKHKDIAGLLYSYGAVLKKKD